MSTLQLQRYFLSSKLIFLVIKIDLNLFEREYFTNFSIFRMIKCHRCCLKCYIKVLLFSASKCTSNRLRFSKKCCVLVLPLRICEKEGK